MSTSTIEAMAQTRQQPVEHLMQMASGFMISAVVYTAARLNLADLLRDGPQDMSDLAIAAGCNEDALYRVLRALASVGIFSETSPRRFALSPASEPLRSDVPGSVRDLILWLANRLHFHVWAELLHSVQSGKPAIEHMYGKPAFECMAEMPDVAHEFNLGMTCVSTRLAPAVLEAYDFSGINTLMDVAGGHGYILCEVLKRYPDMRGILFDVASVVEGAKCRLCSLKLDHRCRTIAGDFFESIPGKADAYYMQHIIHDWDDDRALKILGNCRQALAGRKDGRLLVVDCVIPEGGEPHPGKLVDLEMLLMPGGRERTEQETRALFSKAGFRITRIVPTRAADSVIEARLK